MEKTHKKIVLLIRTASDLNRLEDYLNKNYNIIKESRHGIRDYYILTNEPQRIIEYEKEKEIADFRVIAVKGNPNYVEILNSLKKDGFIIVKGSMTGALLIKYRD